MRQREVKASRFLNMNRLQLLLLQLSEEATEVQKSASKAIRFGMDSVHPKYPNEGNNRDKLIEEINDFMASVEMLQDEGALPLGILQRDLIDAKKAKIEHYIKVSQELGYVAKCD